MLQITGQPPPVAVTDAQGLRAALGEPYAQIDLREDIPITEPVYITAAARLDGRGHVLRRGPGYTGPLLVVEDGGQLTLVSVRLDGSRTRCAPGEPLVCIAGGSVCLGLGAVLENNHTLGSGGAVRLVTGPESPGELRMLADSVIRNCRSEGDGGAVYAQFRDSVARGLVRVAGSSRILDNKAVSGGGVAVHVTAQGQGLVLLEGYSQIAGNVAVRGGGGVYCSHDPGEPLRPVTLRVGGGVRIAENRAVGGGGGGVCLCASPADRLLVGERAQIVGNTARLGGGLCLYTPEDRGGLGLGDATVAGNRAERAGTDQYVVCAEQIFRAQ